MSRINSDFGGINMRNYLQTRNNNNYDIFDTFDDFFRPVFFDENPSVRTNIKETDAAYELDIEMPGYEKDQIKVSLDNGYLTVSAERKQSDEEEKKHFLRREISQSCSRSYYVGTEVSKDNITAKYDKGLLCLTVPKAKPKKEELQYINIE
jgi:HSP20 family molecular chaperone IbpA